MKRLKAGVVNTLSFVKTKDFTTNSFSIKLEKIVGTAALTLTSLTDSGNLDSCKDFITLNVDLLSNDLDGGEYSLILINGSKEYTYLAHIEDYKVTQDGTGVYADSVKFEDL